MVYFVTSKNHGNMSNVEHTEKDNIVTCPMQVAQASGSSKCCSHVLDFYCSTTKFNTYKCCQT